MATLIAKSDNDQSYNGEGYVSPAENAVYATVHDAAAANFVTDYNRYLPVGQRYNLYGAGKYDIFRSVLRFDLSALPAGAPIINAVMSILAGSNPGHYTDWNFTLVDGSVCENPLALDDYGDLEPQQTSLGSIAVSTITGSARFEITLNAAGIAYLLTKVGSVAQFGIRSSDDIGSIAPTGDHEAGESTEMNFSSSIRADEADKPTLTITYAVSPQVSTNPATEVT